MSVRPLGLLVFLAACGPDVNVSKVAVDADSDGYDESVDCDDGHASVHPDASEVCDGVDDDCDGAVDDDPDDGATFFVDADGDGAGDPDSEVVACERPEGASDDGTDCDDAEPRSFPGNPEVCDELDNDCDDAVDEDDATDASAWYEDADGDGYGVAELAVTACVAPDGYVAAGTDCDDTNADVHPDANEADCTDPIDYNCDGSTAYSDADADGVPACEDCDDTDAGRSPSRIEVCDDADLDEDCSGTADDSDAGVSDAPTWSRDVDGDGYGADSGATLVQCDEPAGYSAVTGDCDDYDSRANPGAAEVCDSADLDEDCSGAADDADASVDPTTWTTWYADADGDAYGDATRSIALCDAVSGYVADATDCDDATAARNPGEAEVCDAADVDEDCDGLADDADPSASGGTAWYGDADGDGYGGGSASTRCDEPAGSVAVAGDCDDTRADVSPAGTEVCDSADADEDCDGTADDADASVAGATTWYADSDGDGFGDPAVTTTACAAPSGYLADATDCDDASSPVNPAATEVCDAADTDEDCDGLADEADPSVTGAETWYADADADGFGATTGGTFACDAPAGTIADASDCDDADAGVSPGEPETCDDGVDDDCDGTVDVGCPPSGTYVDDEDYDVRINGRSNTSLFAWTMSGGFDFTGDGAEDLLIADCNGPSYSVAYLYAGDLTPGEQGATDHDYYAFSGGVSGGRGWEVEDWSYPIADLDADGDDELLIVNSYSTAYASLVLGGTVAEGGSDHIYNVDYDGDYPCMDASSGGMSDALTGSPDWLCGDPWPGTSWVGVAYVYSGYDTLVATFTGEASNDSAGSVAGGSDFDGDGYDDYLVGAFGNDAAGTDAGAAYVVYAPLASGTSMSLASADVKLKGETAGGYFGMTVAAPGDLDGDGHDDVVALAPLKGSGSAYVFTSLPSSSVSASAAATEIEGDAGITSGPRLGYYQFTTTSFGDVNGDGAVDIGLGSGSYVSSDGEGGFWLLYGPVSAGTLAIDDVADAVYHGGESDYLGQSLGGSGTIASDLDSDGRDDVVLGSPRRNTSVYGDAGSAFVFYSD